MVATTGPPLPPVAPATAGQEDATASPSSDIPEGEGWTPWGTPGEDSQIAIPPLGQGRTGAIKKARIRRIKELVPRLGRPRIEKRGEHVRQLPTKIDQRLSLIIALALQGLTQQEIADELSSVEGAPVTKNAVARTLYNARQLGKLKDTEVKLRHLIVPLAADTLVHHLRKDDKEVALEVFKGVGLFRHYVAQKGAPEVRTAVGLKVTFTLPEGVSQPPALTGVVVGAPKVMTAVPEVPDEA